MASIALHLRSRPRPFLRPFSSSPNNVTSSNTEYSESNPNPNPDPKTSFTDLKSHLRNPQQQHSPPNPFSFSQRTPPNPNNPNLDDFRNRLREFRNQSVPHPITRSASPPISFQDLYKKTFSDTDSSSSPSSSPGSLISSIRENLRKPENTRQFSLSRLKESLRESPGTQEVKTRILGGAALPMSIFGKELKNNERRHGETAEEDDASLARDYNFEELGKKLRELRPDGGVKGFSVSELNERLVKLRKTEIEEEDNDPTNKYSYLRRTIRTVQLSDNRKTQTLQRINILNHMNGTPSYMSSPPKENLVEKYFHPDNMSSADKLKIELQRVRDEFKMSETDCGSTGVQIAQLTTEISHLSKVLHKKDKHSLKGLIAKVQLRKKLLKYLRRTDWDSYCFILSKFELRDNPGYKPLPSKKHPPKKISSKKRTSKKLPSKTSS